jgi:hypothetical protein
VAFVIDARCTDVQMVEADAAAVECRLVAGEITCPGCGGELRPWGHARWRTLRDHRRPVRVRPRRSRCRSCLVTHDGVADARVRGYTWNRLAERLGTTIPAARYGFAGYLTTRDGVTRSWRLRA